MKYWKLRCYPEGNPNAIQEFVCISPAEFEPIAVKESTLMKQEEFTGAPWRCVEIIWEA